MTLQHHRVLRFIFLMAEVFFARLSCVGNTLTSKQQAHHVLVHVLGVRSDKNQRNFENFARNFSPLSHVWALLSPELEIFFRARVPLRDTPCTWEGYETTVAPFIFDRSARKWISVTGPNGLKISARYPNALL